MGATESARRRQERAGPLSDRTSSGCRQTDALRPGTQEGPSLPPPLNHAQRHPPLPTLPRSFLFPSVDSLFEQPLPSSEPELYSYLHQVKATQPSTRPDSLAWFHSQPRISRLSSPRTYRVLLHYAFEESNLRLVRTLLAEMHERGVKKNERVLRVLLRGYLRHGKEEDAREVAQALGRRGVVLLETKPRVLDSAARGKRKEELEAPWKGWWMRNRETELVKERERVREEARAPQRSAFFSKRRRSARSSSSGPSPSSNPIPLSLPPRQPTPIPRQSAALAGSDVVTLTHRLVTEARYDEAYAVAEMWLRANRPSLAKSSTSSPTASIPPRTLSPHDSHTSSVHTTLSSFGAAAAEFNASALALLHILLRPLFLERAPLFSIRRFVSHFLLTASPPPPSRPLVPNLVTLRTLISGLRGHPEAFFRARKLVDWFGYRWGLPFLGQPDSKRIYFVPPPRKEAEAKRVGVDEGDAAAARPAAVEDEVEPRSSVKPHQVVSPDLALLLLQHSIDAASSSPKTLVSSRQILEIRTWWNALDKDPEKYEQWKAYKVRRAWGKAVEVGVMPRRRERMGERARERIVKEREEEEEERKRRQEEGL